MAEPDPFILQAPQFRYESDFPTVTESVPHTRRAARAILTDCTAGMKPDCLDRALLIITELVGNTVKHAAQVSPRAELALITNDHSLTITVHDSVPRLPHEPTTSPQSGIGGWGLQLVRNLTAEVGGSFETHRDPDHRGKTVRVRLPL